MRIFALEFSSSRRSVAVFKDGAIWESAASSAAPGKDRELKAFALIDDVLAKSGLDKTQIDCIAIGIGPGSYTGIRAAIAIAQGWNVAAPLKLAAISSVDAMAAQFVGVGDSQPFAITVDAQRGEFYWAQYAITSRGPELQSPLQLLRESEVQQRIAEGLQVYGPDLEVPGAHQLFPSAAALTQLAAKANLFLRSNEIEPIYLRETAFVKAPPVKPLPSA